MLDSVMEGFKTIARNDRPTIMAWLKDHPECHDPERFSVYLGMEGEFMPAEGYLNRFGKSQTDPEDEPRVQRLKDMLQGMRCVQLGWVFGVPEKGQDEWLNLVARAIVDLA